MKLMTKQIAKSLPAIYGTDYVDTAEKKLLVKYFTPWSSWTWYGVEYDPTTTKFFGWCDDGQGGAEWGYFMLDELESIRGPFGLKVERDLYFCPKTFNEID